MSIVEQYINGDVPLIAEIYLNLVISTCASGADRGARRETDIRDVMMSHAILFSKTAHIDSAKDVLHQICQKEFNVMIPLILVLKLQAFLN